MISTIVISTIHSIFNTIPIIIITTVVIVFIINTIITTCIIFTANNTILIIIAAIQCLSSMTKSRSSSLPTTPLLSSSSTTATNFNNLAPLYTKRPATLPSTNSEQQQTNINADRNSDASDPRNPKRSRPTRTLVAFMKNKQLLATGYVTPDRTQIHGHRIPENYVCVELTFAATNVQVPCVLGDKEENSLLLSGSYVALLCKDLLVPRNVNKGDLILQPFCSSR